MVEMTKLSIVLWFRVSHCETPGGGRGNLLHGMQRAMICLLSMEEITSSAAPPRNDDGGGGGDCFAMLHSARSDNMFCHCIPRSEPCLSLSNGFRDMICYVSTMI